MAAPQVAARLVSLYAPFKPLLAPSPSLIVLSNMRVEEKYKIMGVDLTVLDIFGRYTEFLVETPYYV